MAIYLGYDRVGIIKTVKVKVFANTTTVSGTYSVVLNNSIGDEVDQLIIDGNSVQDGTPTPETPIEIESVGEKTKNLFDINNIEEGSILTLEGTDYDIENRYRLKFIYLKAGSYTFAINGNVQGGGYLHKYSSANASSWLGSVPFSTMKTINGRNIRTATLDQDCYVRMVILPIGDQVLSKEYLAENKPQLELSSTATEYEPYGYRIPIVSKGKNLLDATKAETGSLVAADGSNFEKTNRARSPFVYLKKGTYTISMSSDISATTMFFYSKPEPSGYFIGKYATTPVVENGIRFATFPVGQDCYMRCVFVPEDENKTTDLGGTTLSNYNVMVEEGITATDYESYIVPREYNIVLDEPLRKIGDYADILDYKNSKVIRKIKEKVFNGTEELGKLDTVQTGLFNYTYYKLGSMNSVINDINLSNLLKYQADFSYQRDGHNTMRVLNTSTYNEARFVFRFHINGANVFEPATVKNLLADFHSQGNPLKLYYAPTTPTEESIELPIILTRDVETIFEVDTEIKPTKLEVSYWEEIK